MFFFSFFNYFFFLFLFSELFFRAGGLRKVFWALGNRRAERHGCRPPL